MSHYDLYESLKLDRNIASSVAAAEIDGRLQSGRTDNPGGTDELQIARQVLGDPEKKAEYDRRLADPSAPEMSISALRQLAARSAVNAPGAINQSGPIGAPADEQGFAHGQAGYSAQPQHGNYPPNSGSGGGLPSFGASGSSGATTAGRGFARSTLAAIAATAVVTAIVISVVWAGAWFLFKDKNGDKGAEKLAQEFVSLQSERETEDWLRQHAARSERDSIESQLGVGTSNFETVDEYLEGRDLTVGKAMSGNEFMSQVLVGRGGEPINEVLDEAKLVWWYVPIFDGERALGQVQVVEIDGDYRLYDVGTVVDLDIDSDDLNDIDDLEALDG